MSFSPLINLQPTTIKKAFLLNAILTAIITAFTIELRRLLDEHKYSKHFPDRPHKLIITIKIATTICKGFPGATIDMAPVNNIFLKMTNTSHHQYLGSYCKYNVPN